MTFFYERANENALIAIAIIAIGFKEAIGAASIFSSLSKFLYYLDSEQWYLAFNYLFFQIHFPTDSLSFYPPHLNIISLFIIYSLFILFLTITHLLTFFYSIVNYYNRKKTFEVWTINDTMFSTCSEVL